MPFHLWNKSSVSALFFATIVFNCTVPEGSYKFYTFPNRFQFISLKKSKIKSFWFLTLGNPLSVRYWLARYCTILLTGVVPKFASLYISFKKKKNHFFLITLYVHSLRRIPPYKHFWKAPQTENPMNPRHTHNTLLFNFDLSLSLQSLSPTTHKIQLPICKNHKINQ